MRRSGKYNFLRVRENRRTLKCVFKALMGGRHSTQFRRRRGERDGNKQGCLIWSRVFPPSLFQAVFFFFFFFCDDCSAQIVCVWGGGRDGGGLLFTWFWLSLMEKDMSTFMMQMFFFKLIALLGQAFFTNVFPSPYPVSFCLLVRTSPAISKCICG